MAIQKVDDFTNLARNGGFLDVRPGRMPQALLDALHANGISDADLQRIAGQDQVIRGAAEFRTLFERIDQVDGASTAKGTAVCDALAREVERNRARAATQGGLRFQGNDLLSQVAEGKAVLSKTTPDSPGSRDAWTRVQQALIDMGYLNRAHGADGIPDNDTRQAVLRFQRDAGVTQTGNVDQDTLSALTSAAPPPGQVLQRTAEYDQLYRDGRLDITIALGSLTHGEDDQDTEPDEERQLLSGLRAQGYVPLNPAAMSEAMRARYGLTPDRYDPHAMYFARTFNDPHTGNQVLNVVRLITPHEGADAARASFQQAMQQDEVVMYFGHARWGTGPDFDSPGSGRGNFVINPNGNQMPGHDPPPTGLRQSIRGHEGDLASLSSRPPYQVLVFNACSTEEYLGALRDPTLFRGRTMTNTDIITTTTGTDTSGYADHALRFLQGFTGRETNNSMLKAQNDLERATRIRLQMENVTEAGYTYTESGFLGNSGNAFVRP